jgi:hypothetical protein
VLAAYRKDDLADPDGWSIQVAEVLARFPKEVVDYVTDPFTGVQAKVKFGVPNLAEIIEACADRMATITATYERSKPRLPEPTFDRSGRPTLAELKAKHGPNWGLKTIDEAIGKP